MYKLVQFTKVENDINLLVGPEIKLQGVDLLENEYNKSSVENPAPPSSPVTGVRPAVQRSKRGRKPKSHVPVDTVKHLSPGIDPNSIIKKHYQVSKW